MVDEVNEWSSRSSIVITQKASAINVTYGFLSIAFAAALIRGHLGAETNAGRLTVDIVMGSLSLIMLAAWIYMHRNPGRIGISNQEIRQWHRGAVRATGFTRADGDLYIKYSGGRHPQPYLRATGTDQAILLTMYDQREITDACVACGWRFVR